MIGERITVCWIVSRSSGVGGDLRLAFFSSFAADLVEPSPDMTGEEDVEATLPERLGGYE